MNLALDLDVNPTSPKKFNPHSKVTAHQGLFTGLQLIQLLLFAISYSPALEPTHPYIQLDSFPGPQRANS